MEEYLHHVHLRVVEAHFGAPHLSQLLTLLCDFWFIFWLLSKSFVDVRIYGFFSLKSVQPQNFEVFLNRNVLSFANIELPALLLVDASGFPLMVVDVVLTLLGLVSLAANYQHDGLQVFGHDTLVL